jgi:hypothetical protein
MFPGGRCRVKPRRRTPSVPRGTSRPPAGYDRIHRSRVRGANATVRAIPRRRHGDRPSSSRIALAGQVPATRDGLDRRGLKGRGLARTQPGGAPGPLSRRAVSCGGSPAGRLRDLISGERTGAPGLLRPPVTVMLGRRRQRSTWNTGQVCGRHIEPRCSTWNTRTAGNLGRFHPGESMGRLRRNRHTTHGADTRRSK